MISDLLEQLVASVLASLTLLQDDDTLSVTGRKQCEHILLLSLAEISHNIKLTLGARASLLLFDVSFFCEREKNPGYITNS
jgi:hypothetical protein